MNKYDKVIKRIFDVIFSLFGIIIFLPILIIIFFVIYFFMQPGSVFFLQLRIGLNGVPFKIIKFRTMVIDNNEGSISILGQNRITKIGYVLRKYKLDELPELFNVLIGNMSFVGPRPDVPGYFDKLVGLDRKILTLKPGITSEASLKYRNEEYLLSLQEDPINFNNNIIFPDKVKLNLEYLKKYSLILDIKIILKTLFYI